VGGGVISFWTHTLLMPQHTHHWASTGVLIAIMQSMSQLGLHCHASQISSTVAPRHCYSCRLLQPRGTAHKADPTVSRAPDESPSLFFSCYSCYSTGCLQSPPCVPRNAPPGELVLQLCCHSDRQAGTLSLIGLAAFVGRRQTGCLQDLEVACGLCMSSCCSHLLPNSTSNFHAHA
jgi:hypothetical protein